MPLYATPRVVTRLEDCFFYHTLDVPGYGTVRGDWDLRGRFDDYVDGVDVAGKRLLDVGTANGFLTIEAEKRGAEVVSFDLADAGSQTLLPFADRQFYTDHAGWVRGMSAEFDRWKNGYWLYHRANQSRAKVHYGNVYKLPAELGAFDVVLLGSILEHLSDPITALGSVARHCKDTLIVVSPVLGTDEPIARFAGRADGAEDFTWWVLSVGIYKEVFGMLGFAVDRVTFREYRVESTDEPQIRGTVVARRLPTRPLPELRTATGVQAPVGKPLSERIRGRLGTAARRLFAARQGG